MRTLQAFPNSSGSHPGRNFVLASAGRWTEVIAVATQWRQRDPAQALQADTAIAAATMQLGNLQGGMAQIAQYLERALKAPDEYPSIILLYAQDLIATKQVDKASELLQPLLTTPRWRFRWLQFSDSISDPATRTTWLDRAASAIPADAVTERIQLAIEYERLSSLNMDISLGEKGTRDRRCSSCCKD